MFLDERLALIYEKHKPHFKDKDFSRLAFTNEIKDALFSDIKIPRHNCMLSAKEFQEFPVRLKQMDNMWKLFCTQTDTENWFKKDDFRKFFALQYTNPFNRERIFKKVGWPTVDCIVDQILFDAKYKGVKYKDVDFGYHATDGIEDTYVWDEDGPWSMIQLGDDMIDFQILSDDGKKLRIWGVEMQLVDGVTYTHVRDIEDIEISNIRLTVTLP